MEIDILDSFVLNVTDKKRKSYLESRGILLCSEVISNSLIKARNVDGILKNLEKWELNLSNLRQTKLKVKNTRFRNKKLWK